MHKDTEYTKQKAKMLYSDYCRNSMTCEYKPDWEALTPAEQEPWLDAARNQG
jgi:hypothetical protein